MASITINIGNADLPRVITGVCGFFNYSATIPQIIGDPLPNPETQAQFARRMVVEAVRSWVKTYEMQQAAIAAQQTASAAADLVNIT